MTLVNVPGAVNFLLDAIKANDLVPEQVIVEFTENEVISRLDEFTNAVRLLKAAGFRVAIDHFGAGFAGLLLLAQFQPERIKINRDLIKDVHKSGPGRPLSRPSSNAVFLWKSWSRSWGWRSRKNGCGLSRRVSLNFRGICLPLRRLALFLPLHGRKKRVVCNLLLS
jgi:hypothetical protein